MIQSYFTAEKRGGFWALSVGIFTCFLAGCVFLRAAPPFYTGIAIPLILVGIVQMAIGSAIARRTDRQADDLEKLLDEDPAEFGKQESQRMAAVLRKFRIYLGVETGIAATGLALILLNGDANFGKGLGAGMLAQALIMLIFHFFAQKRGQDYAAFVGGGIEIGN